MDTASKHLLFVDDEVLVLEMFERMLHSESTTWRFHFVQNADEALAIVREQAGRHFDPRIVAAFERNQTEVTAIYGELCDPAA
jgi:CheY-like chemotaxis protein